MEVSVVADYNAKMSNQFGTSKNPPWARQDFASQNTAGLIQTNITYPYTQTQQFAQQQLAPVAGNLQVTQATLISQTGLPIPSALTGSTSQISTVSYPIKTQTAATNVPTQKQRIFTGTVTKMHENFGFVDEEVFFQVGSVKGMVPKVGDKVLVEATYNANMPFKWNATRVISLPDTVASSQVVTLQQQQQQQLKTIQQQQQQQQTISMMSSTGMIGSLSNIHGGQGLLSNPPGPPPLIPGLGKFQSGGLFSSGSRSGINTGPGLLGDPVPRTSLKDQRGLSVGGGSAHDGQKERDRRDRERRERRESRRKRSRSPGKRSRSPPPRARSPRSPPKRKTAPAPPRYVVQIPKILLDTQETCVISLKSKYSNLYIPSDFFHVSFSWVENFPLTRPFSLGQTCNFQIMHKEVPPIKQEPVVCEPGDADYIFSAKVMLLASPSEEDLYKKSCCLAEDLPDCMENFQHPTRLLQFLVGTRGKNEPMAIGGPWSPSLDGPNPESNPLVLIKTAIRTTKALTGIDLSTCTQWYRFAEIRYFRAESKHKERVQPARVETVVFFLPDVWTCNPTRLEWISLQAAYQKQLQQKLNPAQQQEDEEEAEQQQEMETKTEPSHYSKLDPKEMKVGDLRHELELRNISPNGLKSQLVTRLMKALKVEQEKEQEDKEMEAEKAAEEEAAKVEEESTKDDNDDEDNSESKRKEDEEQQRKDKREKAMLERRYKLSETPSILVHPSSTAKGGKFDCSVMSLSLLLDYRPEDNKEHSFEVSLFAELFNEMLMRDFGFQIYKCMVSATSKGDEEKKKVKDDKKEKEDKSKDEKKEKEKKGEKKSNTEKNGEPSPKRKKSDDKTDKDDQKDKEDTAEEGSINGDDDESRDDNEKKDKDDKKKKKDEDKQKKTVNPSLLLAFSYFDQNHCGYLTDKDTEDIIHTLGLKLSRAQVKKLLQKVIHHEMFKYRKYTDRELDEGGACEQEEQEQSALSSDELEQLAKGNNESLQKLLEQSRVSLESPHVGKESSSNAGSGEDQGFLYYKGALLDIESLMQRLERSEKSRTALEKNLKDLTDELKSVKTQLTEQESTGSRLQHDLRKTRADLDHERSLCSSFQSQNREWQRLATESRSYMMNALNSLNTALNKDEGKPKSEEHRAKNDEHKKKDVKNEVEEKERDESIKEEST